MNKKKKNDICSLINDIFTWQLVFKITSSIEQHILYSLEKVSQYGNTQSTGTLKLSRSTALESTNYVV